MTKPFNDLPRPGQYRWDPDTGELRLVAPQATETPELEEQGNLLLWAEATEKLKRWKEAQ